MKMYKVRRYKNNTVLEENINKFCKEKGARVVAATSPNCYDIILIFEVIKNEN